MTEKAPFFWLRKIAAHLQDYDQIPLFGQAPSFDWEKFSSQAESRFGVTGLKLRPAEQQWRTSELLSEGLGSDAIVLPVKVSPLSGSAFWIMPKQSIVKLTSWMISGQIKVRPLSADILMAGFYRYLGLQLLDVASNFEPLNKITPVISAHSQLPETDAFCIDVEIEFGDNTCWGRLAIEPELQKSAAKFFSHPSAPSILSSVASATELTLGVKVGSIQLDPSAWDGVNEGDFIALDEGGYDARKHQGAAYLTLGESTLFQIKIKQNKIDKPVACHAPPV